LGSDFQNLLSTSNLTISALPTYYESTGIPADFLEYKRISAKAQDKTGCCPSKSMVVYWAEQENVDILLRDANKKPSLEWGETFATFRNNRIQIYTNGEFNLVSASLIYYRQPTKILIAGVYDPYNPTATPPLVDTPCEFKDDIVEVLIDECAKIIAGDIEAMVQQQIQTQSVETNN